MLKKRPDLIKHFAVGLVFGVLTYFSWAFFALASMVFIAKEAFDMVKANPTGWDWIDLLFDYLGLFTTLIIMIWLF